MISFLSVFDMQNITHSMRTWHKKSQKFRLSWYQCQWHTCCCCAFTTWWRYCCVLAEKLSNNPRQRGDIFGLIPSFFIVYLF